MNTWCFPVIVAVACCVGCGTNGPLSGTVTFSDDGSPVPAGTVCFENNTRYGRGQLDQNGRYTLGFEKQGNGIPRGVYGVYVTGAQRPLGMSDEPGSVPGSRGGVMKYEELVAKKFHARRTSGITCNVDGSTRTFDFQVDRAEVSVPPRK